MDQYLPIVLMLAIGVAFAAGSFLASAVLGPKRPTAAKEGPYESGIVPRRSPAARFPVRFYLVAMIFIIFDIEVVFLYPWAVEYHQLARFGLAEMGTFAAIVFISFAYLVSNGALDWGPVQGLRNRPGADLTRTTTSTVRRVPRPSQVALDGPALRPADEPAESQPGELIGEETGPAAEPVTVGAGEQTGAR